MISSSKVKDTFLMVNCFWLESLQFVLKIMTAISDTSNDNNQVEQCQPDDKFLHDAFSKTLKPHHHLTCPRPSASPLRGDFTIRNQRRHTTKKRTPEVRTFTPRPSYACQGRNIPDFEVCTWWCNLTMHSIFPIRSSCCFAFFPKLSTREPMTSLDAKYPLYADESVMRLISLVGWNLSFYDNLHSF